MLKAVKDDAIIINVARGGLIDQAALVSELEKGRFRELRLGRIWFFAKVFPVAKAAKPCKTQSITATCHLCEREKL